MILIVQPTVYGSLSRAFQRVVGVLMGVAAALAVSHFLTPSGWSIAIVVFAGLLLGWTVRLGPQGVVQVPVSALLVFAVGSATPGYGARRVLDTLIGSAVAVVAVLVSPPAPSPLRVAPMPLHHCGVLATSCGTSGLPSARRGQSKKRRRGAKRRSDWSRPPPKPGRTMRVINSPRVGMQGPVEIELCSIVLDEALQVGEKIAIQTRSISRALVDGAPDARPMPGVGAMLVSTASAIEAYAEWVASPGESTDRQRLSYAIRVAGETFGRAVVRAQERWRDDPKQWLTFGTLLTMSQRILGEVSSPIESNDDERI